MKRKSQLSYADSLEQYRLLIDLAPDVIYAVDLRGNIILLSPAFEKITGWKTTDWLGKPFKDLIHPEDLTLAMEKFAEGIQKKPLPYELRVLAKNGSYITGEFRNQPYLQNKKVIGKMGIARDITERKIIEEKLWQANHALETIIHASPLAVYVVDPQGKVQMWNTAAENLFGWKAEEVVGEQLPIPPTEKQGEFHDLMDALLNGNSFTRDLVRQRKDGTLIDVSVSASPLFDETGKITGVVAITSDISQRIAEQRKKDEFISLAAHELRTPVTSIKLFLDVLQNYLHAGKTDQFEHFITQISEQTNKLTDLVNDLLDVSRIETGKLTFQMEKICLSSLVDETVATVSQMFPNHTFRKHAPRDIEIMGDKYRIYQVLVNLLTNASKYSPQQTTVTIRLTKKNGQAIVSVKDQGIGIPSSEQKKIFDKLYQITNKDIKLSAGLGMGLYIAREIIKGHNGEIWVTSMPGKGSTFSFSLPYTALVTESRK